MSVLDKFMKGGGPAFPTQPIALGAPGEGHFVGSGMTLRDYFAAHALIGFIARFEDQYPLPALELARDAFTTADAMLAERAK